MQDRGVKLLDVVTVGIIGVTVMVFLMLIGVNIGFSMGIVGFIGYIYVAGWTAAFSILRTIPFYLADNFTLTVIPLFVLMGHFAFHSGLSGGLFKMADRWLCKVRGGLAVASIASCAAFSAVCGSTVATAATMGTIAYPEMKKAGYNSALSTGCLAAGGTLGIMLPPSTLMIIYGVAAEVSIVHLFAAGIIPGVILTFAYAATVMIQCKIKPHHAPSIDRQYSWKEKFQSLSGVLPVVILFGAVIGGMFAGVFSSTEAAGIGAVIGLVFTIVSRKFTIQGLIKCLTETAKTVGMVFTILFGAIMFGYFLTVAGIPVALANWITSMDINRYVVILIMTIIYIILGAIMDELAMVLLTIPVFLPIVRALGFDPVWFGIYIVMVSNIGLMMPPVGLNVFVIAGVVKEVPLFRIYKGVMPFVGACIVVLVFCVYFEELSLLLPRLLYSS